ncbi:MAG: hypothetical protein JWQ35_1850 [Bacteriovoracaceae bacterium]|nr:hypothetical protein [Bacteriovoracaceae bacterium]
MRAARRSDEGFALLFAIILIVVMAIAGGYFLKRSDQFRELQLLSQQKNFQTVQLLSEANLFARGSSSDQLLSFGSQLDAYEIPNNAQPLQFDASLIVTGDPHTDINAWLATNIVGVYNNQPENKEKGKSLSLLCLYEIDPDTGLRYKPCTSNRLHDPKVFQFTLSQVDPARKILSRVTEQLQFARSSINEYSYIVTNSHQDVHLGRITFESPVVINFAQPHAVNGIVFQSTTPPGTVFNSTLFTNLSNATQLNYKSGAQAIVNKVAFENSYQAAVQTAVGFVSLIQNAYTGMSNQVTTINHLSGGVTPPEASMLAYCLGLPNSTTASLCTTKVIWSSFDFNGSNLTLVETVEASYNGVPLGTNDPSRPDYVHTGTNIVSSGPQTDGVYFLPGPANQNKTYIREWNGVTLGKQITLQASMTLMSVSLAVQSSMVKSSPDSNKNSALFGQNLISIGDPSDPTKDVMLDDGSGSGITLAAQKATQQSLPDAQKSFTLQTTIVPSGTSNFTIPPIFYDSNGGTPITLGTLVLEGLIVTGDPFVTTQSWSDTNYNTYYSGFTTVNMTQGKTLVSHPPPGINFKVSLGLDVSMTHISASSSPIEDAIKEFQSQ